MEDEVRFASVASLIEYLEQFEGSTKVRMAGNFDEGAPTLDYTIYYDKRNDEVVFNTGAVAL